MRRAILILVAVAALPLGMFAADDDQPRSRPVRARPPVFPQHIVELFSRDVPTMPVAGSSAGTTAAPPAENSTTKLTWSKLITLGALEDEIKSYKPLLAVDLRSPATFKSGGYQKCERELSMLAACFAIGMEYDGPFRWKNQAAVARDLFSAAAYHCLQGDDAAFEVANRAARDLDALLRGDPTARNGPAPEPNYWPRIVARPRLMNRMEQAQQRGLTVWTANQTSFSKNIDKIRREAMILAMLAEVIKQPGFEFADDKAFVGHAQALQKNCLELLDAAQANSFEEARKATGNITKSCTACHGEYR